MVKSSDKEGRNQRKWILCNGCRGSKISIAFSISVWFAGWSFWIIQWEARHPVSWRSVSQPGLCNGSSIICYEQLIYQSNLSSNRTLDQAERLFSWCSHASEEGIKKFPKFFKNLTLIKIWILWSNDANFLKLHVQQFLLSFLWFHKILVTLPVFSVLIDRMVFLLKRQMIILA